MASSTVVADGLPAGGTYTLELYAEGSDTLAQGAADTLTEATNRYGYYSATVTEALNGWYYALVVDGSDNKIGDGWVLLVDTADTFIIEDSRQHHIWKVNVTGIAEAGTLSTTQMSTDLSEATDDHYVGRLVVWTTGVLANQASDITSYTGTGGILTFTAITEAPSAGDGFIIL